jgi:hypothetical protein
VVGEDGFLALSAVSDPDMISPGLIGWIDGNTYRDFGLLVPSEVVTVTGIEPAGVPAGIVSVAVAEVEFTTLTLLTVPLPALTVIGAPNCVPVRVNGDVVPTAAKAGLMLVSVGSTLIDMV